MKEYAAVHFKNAFPKFLSYEVAIVEAKIAKCKTDFQLAGLISKAPGAYSYL